MPFTAPQGHLRTGLGFVLVGSSLPRTRSCWGFLHGWDASVGSRHSPRAPHCLNIYLPLVHSGGLAVRAAKPSRHPKGAPHPHTDTCIRGKAVCCMGAGCRSWAGAGAGSEARWETLQLRVIHEGGGGASTWTPHPHTIHSTSLQRLGCSAKLNSTTLLLHHRLYVASRLPGQENVWL